jgi:hypothetical protein
MPRSPEMVTVAAYETLPYISQLTRKAKLARGYVKA